MFSPENINLSDIISSPNPSVEYVKNHVEYRENFDNYTPKQDVLKKITSWLDKKNEILTIVAFGATWCGDCIRNVPQLAKIDQIVNDSRFKTGILGDIKVMPPYERKPGQLIWKVPPSPPETADPKFDMFHIPAIFIFNKEGQCLGKIDENPTHTTTVEEEIEYYLD